MSFFCRINIAMLSILAMLGPALAFRVCDRPGARAADPSTVATETAITVECLADLGYADNSPICLPKLLKCVNERGSQCAQLKRLVSGPCDYDRSSAPERTKVD
jgi:hypothetical protein